MTVAELREVLERAAAELGDAELADAIGACAATEARLLARMTAPKPPEAEADEWATAPEVARRFKLSVSTINELSRLGKLPHRMYGRYRRFRLADVAAAGLNSESDEHGTQTKGRKAA